MLHDFKGEDRQNQPQGSVHRKEHDAPQEGFKIAGNQLIDHRAELHRRLHQHIGVRRKRQNGRGIQQKLFDLVPPSLCVHN